MDFSEPWVKKFKRFTDQQMIEFITNYQLGPYDPFLTAIQEMLERLWFEFEGHRDECRLSKSADSLQEEIKKFTQGFAYRKPQGETMDKQIRKVEKDVIKGDKKKAEKDIKTLKKMDKKFAKKIDKAKKVMKGKC